MHICQLGVISLTFNACSSRLLFGTPRITVLRLALLVAMVVVVGFRREGLKIAEHVAFTQLLGNEENICQEDHVCQYSDA